MTCVLSRRTVLAALPLTPAVLLAGCVDGGDAPENDDADGTAEEDDSTDENTADADDADEDDRDDAIDDEREADPDEEEPSKTVPEREKELERLPERSPLAGVLENLFVARDREAYAEMAGLDYRDGAVRVHIDLEPDGEPPEEYLPADWTEANGTVFAFVAVDDLVDLALDDDVRMVRREPPAETHGERG